MPSDPCSPTPVPADATRGRRAYTLIAVMVIGIIIAAGAIALVITGREASRSGANDKKSANAYAVALAGLTWANSTLSDSTGLTALGAAAGGTAQTVQGVRIQQFNPDDQYGGAGSAPPAVGTSTAVWTSYGDGHYALFGATNPLKTGGSVVRALGMVGQAQVVLETTIVVNLLRSLPGALTGCFTGDVQITFYDQESPYDYTGNMRFDGDGGIPIGMSDDHDRLNGMARNVDDSLVGPTDRAPLDPAAGYPKGLRWRGTQSLRGTEGVASGVANKYGGTAANVISDQIGAFPGWPANAYMANDPRIVDRFDATSFSADSVNYKKGFGLGPDGAVNGQKRPGNEDAEVQRGQPLIAYINAPAPIPARAKLRKEEDWDGVKDNRARKGFYACDNHAGNSRLSDASEGCIKGSTGAKAPAWKNNALNHSGRAYGFISMVSRQCTGSGDSINPDTGAPWYNAAKNPNGIKCAPSFEWLENLAACTILPLNARAIIARGTNVNRLATLGTSGDGNLGNDLAGCHPGCLLAADFDGDGLQERPLRSACVNLDDAYVSTYGPGFVPVHGSPVVYEAPADDADWNTQFPATAPAVALNDHPITAPVTDPAWSNNTYYLNWYNKDSDGDRAAIGGGDWLDWIKTGSGGVPAISDADVNNNVFRDGGGARIQAGGYVSERGSPSFITRLDMTDRGPLGTCQQNCLAFGFGKDSTYGAHRTDRWASPGIIGTATNGDFCSARVPKDGVAAGVLMHCNLDYDRDGIMDRKSFAIASSYREECADPHDGMAWAPAFNISTANTNISSGGCTNDLPNFTAATSITMDAFCDQGGLSDLNAAIAAIEPSATIVAPATFAGVVGKLTKGANWFGGARCHVGTGITYPTPGADPIIHPAADHGGTPMAGIPNTDKDALGHPDYWIEDTCPDPQNIKVTGDFSPALVCGCGTLILNNSTLTFDGNDHFLWRGLVIWRLNTGSKDTLVVTSGYNTFLVSGGTLATGDDDFGMKITQPAADDVVIANTTTTNFKWSMSINHNALSDAPASGNIASVRRLR